MTPATRLVLGAVLATLVALAAARGRLLSRSGALAAIAVGAAATAAGWRWCAVLLAFFASAAALSRWRRERKDRLAAAIVDKGGARDAVQVVANGGVFAAAALATLLLPAEWVSAAALGALATAGADTWATEVGVAIGGQPRAVPGFARVPPGTSGAVSAAGTLALLAGGLLVGVVALVSGFDRLIAVAGAIGGVLGAVVDTLLGATIQERRRCPRCGSLTEQRVHHCGTPTARVGGLAFMTNDIVNLTSTGAGAIAAALVSCAWR